MLGFLDRFSVDLDFDLLQIDNSPNIRQGLNKLFAYLELEIVRQSKKSLLFELRYKTTQGKRNLLKLSVIDPKITSNVYQVQYFAEIDRLINSQTIESMFANKLVAVMDRYMLYGKIAGRDIYDIHHFFTQSYCYGAKIIEDRTGNRVEVFLHTLLVFIRDTVTQKVLSEDLNMLLPNNIFQQIRKVLLPETIHLLTQEQKTLAQAIR